MIRSIHVKNFKTLRDVTLPFAEGITVFVGANNSGKTNALQLLSFVAEAAAHRVHEPLQAHGGGVALRTRGSTGAIEYEVEAEFDKQVVTYGLEIWGVSPEHSEWLRGSGFHLARNKNGQIPHAGSTYAVDHGGGLKFWATTPPPSLAAKALLDGLTEIGVYDLSPAALRLPSLVRRDPVLGADGAELAAVLDALPPRIRDAIDKEVSGAAHDVRKVTTVPTEKAGVKIIGIEEASGELFGADQISDGLLMFIGLSTALQMKQTRKTLIAIEEPERGIHPRRLEQLVDQLWRLTESGTQVVITTHSPLLLDQFRDYPESVVIFDRQGADTRVTRLVEQRAWRDALELDVRALGDIWYSGVLGGVPPP